MVNEKLRATRISKGMSQTFISKKLGYKYASGYANIEMGRTKASLEIAKKISEILESEMEELFFTKQLHKKSNSNST